MLFEMILTAAGLLISLLLFYRFPSLKKGGIEAKTRRLSIVIPARNEAVNLPLLLQDLQNQSYPAIEIICVDDCSTDNTATIASAFNVKLIRITEKPCDWTGKAYACQTGAKAATGDVLLFLDADVRLRNHALSRLMQTYEENRCVISVQPYHQTYKSYEQFSLFFNLIQVPSNGTGTFFKFKNAGLYGPVILIDKDTYWSVDGHTSAKNSIVDDVSLGEALAKKGKNFKLFLGSNQISFRMYAGGFPDLLHGWTKNYSTGAFKTPFLLFLMVFLWVASCLSAFIHPIQAILTGNWLYSAGFTVTYLFGCWNCSEFPEKSDVSKSMLLCFSGIYGTFCMGVFCSLIKKLFHLEVVWKGRKIKLEK
jgi:4,4'-diaponeurosporenoate glycosyltransferase